MVGRRYSDGLHQAIEAIENVNIRAESQTLASVTFQNYFRMYKKLAGMTGTAMTEEAEFGKIYSLEVLEIPTNKPMIRNDSADVIYKTKMEKYKAIVTEVERLNKKQIPVLVGTITIDTSELLSQMLKRKGVSHSVLNAKHHEKEAEIVKDAGAPGAVMIATNMAGRGTDIVLGESVAASGGLHILGTERHESRRIDNQLRGRAGRQGDPGFSKFYVSLEDDLMRLFGSDRIKTIMETLGLPDDTPIEHRMVSRALEKAQKKVEMHNFEIRKQVLKFDDVMNKQRDSFYKHRRNILENKNTKEYVLEHIEGIITDFVNMNLPEKKDMWRKDDLVDSLTNVFPIDIREIVTNGTTQDEISNKIKQACFVFYGQKELSIGADPMRDLEKMIILKVTDTKWIDHLHNMDILRDGIGLRAYGQKDPLIEYQIEGYNMFKEMMVAIEEEAINMLFRVQPVETSFEYQPQVSNISYEGGNLNPTLKPVRVENKVGRNDPCPCGSGKKYKKCHGS
jgi:preprotein translocase subunit SecA